MFERSHMTIGAWAVYHLLLLIPFVNVILIIMLLLSSKTNKSLKNLILFQIILIIITFALGIALFGTLVSMLNQLETR